MKHFIKHCMCIENVYLFVILFLHLSKNIVFVLQNYIKDFILFSYPWFPRWLDVRHQSHVRLWEQSNVGKVIVGSDFNQYTISVCLSTFIQCLCTTLLTMIVLFSSKHLAPQNIEPSPSCLRLWRWFRIAFIDVDKLHNRYIFEPDNLCPLDQLEAKVEDQDDRDIDVRRDESLRAPSARH